MAIRDRRQIKVSFLFEVLDSAEVAVCSYHISGSGGGLDANPLTIPFAAIDDAWLADRAAAYLDMVSSTAINWADFSKLVGVKAALLDENLHYVTDPKLHAVSFGSTTHGYSDGSDAQDTVVASLWSGHKLGSANYGRMYLPHTRLTRTASSPYASTTALTTVLPDMVTFFNDVNASAEDIGAGIALRLVSKTGVTRLVTNVRLGRVTDTQRNRRNNLTENLGTGTALA